MKKRDINTLSDLKRYSIELKSAYTAGGKQIKSTAQQSVKGLLPWNLAIKFAENKMNRKINNVLDVKGQLIPNVAGYILHKTVFRKVGFFKKILLSFGTKQLVKYFLNKKTEKPLVYKSLPLARNNDIINVVKKKMNLNPVK
ncbi:hypothetical protein [Pedobacter mucosus]|uniref:hypothetical protein n=1 Tax=Pedobacter mucosus TaxID=2895286 RepID=UPI001EE3B444|nr:hypothetical protein [Pedobacter mucosus]UKT62587.1 hypothetical protein LOK61_12540 [Pedobacter mucosus]